jgi:hypothetical protein
VFSGGFRKKRDFKLRAVIRQPHKSARSRCICARKRSGLAKNLSTVFVDNDVHILQKVNLSGIGAMPFARALKKYATLNIIIINSLL